MRESGGEESGESESDVMRAQISFSSPSELSKAKGVLEMRRKKPEIRAAKPATSAGPSHLHEQASQFTR